jgi:hypothetical protein
LANCPVYAQQDATDRDIRYVKVDSSSPDATILDSTDFFEAEALCNLRMNQKVRVLSETDGEYVKVRATCKGKAVEGWVKKLILADKIVVWGSTATESAGAKSQGVATKGTVAPGLPPLPREEPDETEDEGPPL